VPVDTRLKSVRSNWRPVVLLWAWLGGLPALLSGAAPVTPSPRPGDIVPREVAVAAIVSGSEDTRLVAVSGVATSAGRTSDGALHLTLADKGRSCEVYMPGYPSDGVPSELVDARMKVTGVCAFEPGGNGKPGRSTIWGRSPADMAVLKPAATEGTLPYSQILKLVTDGPTNAPSNRIRLRGSVTYAQGREVYLQDGSGGILVDTDTPLKEGDEIDLSGFLDWQDSLPTLRNPHIRAKSTGVPPPPIGISASILNSGKLVYSLVRLNATVVQQSRHDGVDELVCRDGQLIFVADLKSGPTNVAPPLEPESEVQLTGFVAPQIVSGGSALAPKLILRSSSDILLLRPPSWWTARRLTNLLGSVCAGVLLAGGWVFMLRRKVSAQAALIDAQFEKETVLEAQYSDLVQNASDIVYTHDLEGNLTSVNESGQRLLGYRTDELMRMNLSDFLPEEGLHKARAMLDQKIKDRGRTTYEVPAIDKYGRRVDLEVSSWVVYREGKPFSVQGIARDISSRRVAEKALREGEQKYRDVVETSQDLIWSVDAHGRWTFVNRAALRIYGCDPEELRGRPVAEREAVSNSGFMERALANLDGREALGFESWHKRRDGTLVLLSFQAIVVRDAKGDLLGLQGSARDITQHKRDQENILRLAAAVQQATEIVAILDTAGVIQYVNPSFERITEFRTEDAMGRGFSFLLAELPETPSFLEIAATISRSGFWSGRLRARKRDQNLFDAEATISSIRDEQKRVINYACLLRDVSRESHLEEQVRLSQKMEAIGLLAGGVAHDFNNLLQVIDGYAGLALGSLGAVEECRQNLEKVLSATLRATQLTRQLLAFGRQQTLQTVDADLNDLVAEHLHMVRRLIGTHIEVEFFPEPDLQNVRVDRGQMEQVLLNLCINARDAMSSGGQLMVELRNETLDAPKIPPGAEMRPGPAVRLTVRDNGAGMDKATISRIFDPFFTTKAKGKGTGLGLSVVYGIIKQHGGFIQVESDPGVGTKFNIYLPATERGDSVVIRKPGNVAATGEETVLLAEDEPLVREIASKVLMGAGYKVILAENGQEAVEFFDKTPGDIDLLLFDVLMPRLGGPAAYLQIRKVRADVPVLFCTGFGGTDPLLESLMAEGLEVLNKPYSAHHFLERVRHTLDHFTSPTGLNDLPPQLDDESRHPENA